MSDKITRNFVLNSGGRFSSAFGAVDFRQQKGGGGSGGGSSNSGNRGNNGRQSNNSYGSFGGGSGPSAHGMYVIYRFTIYSRTSLIRKFTLSPWKIPS